MIKKGLTLEEAFKALNGRTAVKESIKPTAALVSPFNSPSVFEDIIAKKIMLEMRYEDIGDGHGQGYGCIVADPSKDGTALLYEGTSNGIWVVERLDVAQYKKVLELLANGLGPEVIKIQTTEYVGDDKIHDPYYEQNVNLKNVRRSDLEIENISFDDYVESAQDSEDFED